MILKTVVDQALAGDDVPVPIAELTWWREAIDEPDPVRSIRLHARNMCRITQRAAPVLRALETAASLDADAAEMWERFQHQRRVGLNEFAVALTTKTTRLRLDEDTMTDPRCILASDAYLRLVRDAGWPLEKFETWLADVIERLFVQLPSRFSPDRGRCARALVPQAPSLPLLRAPEVRPRARAD